MKSIFLNKNLGAKTFFGSMSFLLRTGKVLYPDKTGTLDPACPYAGIIRIRFNGCNLRFHVQKRSTTPVWHVISVFLKISREIIKNRSHYIFF